MICAIILSSLLLFLIYYLIKWCQMRRITLKFPGPMPLPFIGNTMGYNRNLVKNFQKFINLNKKYGNAVALHGLGLQWDVFIADPRDVKTVLSSGTAASKSWVYDMIAKRLGNGLLLSNGGKWHSRREYIIPSFHSSILQQYLDIFNEELKIMLDKLEPHSNEKDFDIKPFISLAALDSICRTTLGLSFNAQTDPKSEYVALTKKLGKLINDRLFSICGRHKKLFQYTDLAQKQSKIIKRLHEITSDNITSRKFKLALDSSRSIRPKDDDIELKKKIALLDLILKTKSPEIKPPSVEDNREEIDTFIYIGHETTTNGTSATLYYLSRYSQIQQKVYEEIVKIFGDNPSTVLTYSKLQELNFIEMVIKEALRLLPPIPIIGRKLTEPTNIAGVLLPPGKNILISVYALHRDPTVFPNPEIFNPQRFTSDKMEKRDNYSYIPFSAGPRSCIGEQYAMLEMKAFIVKILLSYRLLEPKGNCKLNVWSSVLLETNEIQLRLQKRK